MLNIRIQTIPHHKQRYETVGDWFFEPTGAWIIHISDMSNWRMEFPIAVHELVECALCRWTGITVAEVDAFDTAYESSRSPDNYNEPGDDPRAPYHKQHCIATGIERIVVCMLGLNWKEYDEAVNALQYCK